MGRDGFNPIVRHNRPNPPFSNYLNCHAKGMARVYPIEDMVGTNVLKFTNLKNYGPDPDLEPDPTLLTL
jgi:hypothetical protein